MFKLCLSSIEIEEFFDNYILFFQFQFRITPLKNIPLLFLWGTESQIPAWGYRPMVFCNISLITLCKLQKDNLNFYHIYHLSCAHLLRGYRLNKRNIWVRKEEIGIQWDWVTSYWVTQGNLVDKKIWYKTSDFIQYTKNII